MQIHARGVAEQEETPTPFPPRTKKGLLSNLHPLDKWKAIFTVSFVATILTIAELVVMYQIIFVDIQEQLQEAVQSQVNGKQSLDGSIISLLDSVFGTMYLRERETIGSLNYLVFSAAVLFVLILLLFTLYAAVRLRMENRSNRGIIPVYINAFASSMLTLFLIGLFQGFPCIVNKNGMFCLSNSFMQFTKHWNFNENYLGMIWNTGLCSGEEPYEGRDKTLQEVLLEAIRPHVEDEVRDETSSNEKLNEVQMAISINK